MDANKPKGISPSTEQYYKAKHYLLLFSASLFAWAFIGVDLKESGIVKDYISLKSPDAAPLVIFILIVYFLYKTYVEWQQVEKFFDDDNLFARFDFIISNIISVSAIGVFVFQKLIEEQLFLIIADWIGLILGLISLIILIFIMIEAISSMTVMESKVVKIGPFSLLMKRVVLIASLIVLLPIAYLFSKDRIITSGLYGFIILITIYVLLISMNFLRKPFKKQKPD